MHAHCNSNLVRQFVMGALFAASLAKPRHVMGYTMVVYGDPIWGCVGYCGGDGYSPYGDWTGDGERPFDAGGSNQEPGSEANPYVLIIRADATCRTAAEQRETAASAAYRASFLVNGEGVCNRESQQSENEGQYYQVTFDDDSVGIYQRSDSGCASSHLMWEIRAPQCRE